MTPEQLDMHKRLQPLYKRVMGEWQEGDMYYSFEHKKLLYTRWSYRLEKYITAATAMYIPRTIDSEHPERGLWGMLDWTKLKQEQYGPDGEIAIYKLPYIEYCEELGIPVKDHPFVVDDPTTAILKALCEQEGV